MEDYRALCCSFRRVRVFVPFSAREAWMLKPLRWQSIRTVSDVDNSPLRFVFGGVETDDSATQQARGPRTDHLMYIAHKSSFSKRKAAM